jgi:hypothetical protein
MGLTLKDVCSRLGDIMSEAEIRETLRDRWGAGRLHMAGAEENSFRPDWISPSLAPGYLLHSGGGGSLVRADLLPATNQEIQAESITAPTRLTIGGARDYTRRRGSLMRKSPR